jgi:hypothetical protein
MKNQAVTIGGALAAFLLAPAIASAEFVLDTGTPTGTGAPVILSDAQSFAAEFQVTAAEEVITSLAAYLTQGAGQPNDTFTFDIYSNTGFTSRPSNRPAPVYSTTGTFTANGWNTAAVNNWTLGSGFYWLALQVSSPTQTKGLDLPLESSTSTGTQAALAFASAGTSGQYAVSGADPIGVQIQGSAVPLPAAFWLFGSGMLGLGAMARRRIG